MCGGKRWNKRCFDYYEFVAGEEQQHMMTHRCNHYAEVSDNGMNSIRKYERKIQSAKQRRQKAFGM